MPKNVVKVAAGLGAAGVIAVSGAALASSQTTSPNAPSSSSTQQQAPKGGHMHGTPVTGATLTSVTNAVKAKDSAITVKVVFTDPDGSYDALGTKAGQPVHVDVSKDLKTVTVQTGFGHGGRDGGRGHGGPGGHQRGTEVTGATLTNLKTAVKAKDSAVTVEKAFKDADGTYHVMGTKAGQHVHVEVSKDLKTVTVNTGDPGGRDGHRGHGDHGGFGGQQGQQGQAPSGSSSASGTQATGTPA